MSGQGVISSNDLMKKLVNARKVMDKVETGNYERGNVNEDILRKSPEELNLNALPVNENITIPNNTPSQEPVVVDVDRVNKSKLPDVIKKAMIENPIPKIALNDSINMDFVKGAKRLMEQEGIPTKKTQSQRQPQYQQPSNNFSSQNFDINTISMLIENAVRKVLDEKLTQILTAHETTSINENLVLRVGDSVFKGKITGVNKTK